MMAFTLEHLMLVGILLFGAFIVGLETGKYQIKQQHKHVRAILKAVREQREKL